MSGVWPVALVTLKWTSARRSTKRRRRRPRRTSRRRRLSNLHSLARAYFVVSSLAAAAVAVAVADWFDLM